MTCQDGNGQQIEVEYSVLGSAVHTVCIGWPKHPCSVCAIRSRSMSANKRQRRQRVGRRRLRRMKARFSVTGSDLAGSRGGEVDWCYGGGDSNVIFKSGGRVGGLERL